MNEYSDIVSDGKIDPRWSRQTNLKDIPHPAKSKWQGLTDDEREEICRSDPYRPTEMLKLAEAKLKEKNNG